jgi:hypothetical protein
MRSYEEIIICGIFEPESLITVSKELFENVAA